MKLWMCQWHDPDDGTCQTWHPNRADAEAAMLVIQQERGEAMPGDRVVQVDVPTAKHDLLRWLNRNFSRDNG